MPPSRRNKRVSVDKRENNVKKLKVENVVKEREEASTKPTDTEFSVVFREVIGNEIEELEKFVKYKSWQVRELENKCVEYEKVLEEKHNDLQYLTENYKKLEIKNMKMKESMSQYENLREKYDMQIGANREVIKNEFLERVKDLEDDKKSLQEKLSTEMNHKSKLESFVIEKDEKLSNFRKQIDVLSQKCKDVEKAKGQENFAHVEKHKSRIQDLELEKEELSRSVSSKDAQIQDQYALLSEVKGKLVQSQEEECKLKLEWADVLKEKNEEIATISDSLEEERKDKEFFKSKLCENEEFLKQKDAQIERISESVKDEIAFFTEEKTQLESNIKSIKIAKDRIEVENKSFEQKVLKMEGELKHMEEMLRSGNTNDEELNELKEKFKTLEDINKLLENKSENSEDALYESKKAMHRLTEELSSLKEIHSKCKEQFPHISSAIASVEMEASNALREELKSAKSDYEILLSQRNIAESKASILDRKVKKLEATVKETEDNIKMEMENFKLMKEDEFEKYKQNFNPAAMKTISILKDEKKSMSADLEKSRTDLENLREATEKYKSAVDKYKLDLFNAEKSALESSIYEHKDVLESLQKMPEKYRRKTLKKLYKKSKERNDFPDSDAKVESFPEESTRNISDPYKVDGSSTPDSSLPLDEKSPEVDDNSSLEELSAPELNSDVNTEHTVIKNFMENKGSLNNFNTSEDSKSSSELFTPKAEVSKKSPKKPKVKESPAFAAFLDNQQNPVKRTKLKSSDSPDVSRHQKNTRVEFKANRLEMTGSTRSRIQKVPQSDNSPSETKTPPTVPTETNPPPTVQSHSLLDSIDRFTSMTKQKAKESERKVLSLQQYKEVKKNTEPREDTFENDIKMTVRKAISDLERKGFFREGRIERNSTETKFFSYFLRKFKDSGVSSEKQKSEIDQTLRLYAGRIREKINKSK